MKYPHDLVQKQNYDSYFAKYIKGHGGQLKDRTARSSHKNGSVEKSYKVLKYVLEKMENENRTADIHLEVARM